jgi:hypothetical protein
MTDIILELTGPFGRVDQAEWLRQRLLPAITILSSGQVRVGKRGQQHAWLADDLYDGPSSAVTVWRRGWFDPLHRRFIDTDEVGTVTDPVESTTSQTIREMRS